MDQLICAFLSHTNYWHEAGMLKVWAMLQDDYWVNINPLTIIITHNTYQYRSCERLCLGVDGDKRD